MANRDDEKRAAIVRALARFTADTYPGDRAVAKALGVSNHLVKRVRLGDPPDDEGIEGELAAETDPPVMAGASIPWQWGAGGLVVVLVIVAALVVARQRQATQGTDPPNGQAKGLPDGRIVFAS